MPRPKICATLEEAVADIPDGITLLIPGFGATGMPWNLLTALYYQGAKGITAVSNGIGTASADGQMKGLGDLVEAGRVKKVIASFTAATHPSRLSKPEQMVRDGTLVAELVPQGTLAERIRAGGAGIPAFYTPAGVGTLLSTGKEHRDFDGETYVLEEAIFADYALIRAWKADTAGNLVFRHAGRNYNPIAAMAARHVIVEVEEPIVEAGLLDPDQVHTPGIYVERLVSILPHGVLRVQRAEPAPAPAPTPTGEGKRRLTRHEMAAVIGQRIQPGWIANLGIGIPTFASNYVAPDDHVTFTSENGVIGYSRLAEPGQGDPDIVNAGGQQVTIVPGASFVHHADSFGLVRSRRLDVTVLGAYEAAADGSFANWRLSNAPWDNLGGIGGAMDLVARAKQIWLAMEHTTRDGQPRLLERCTLPVTSTRGVTLIVTDIAVISVQGGRFLLEEHAPGYTAAEIASLTGAPLDVSPSLREVSVTV
ncbi:MAG: 3-oxoacid CoA-transferase subunit A [Dehalococcoidia bacterium]|nr:MAG: 3-oxoacid CoA-transferase subunit A [Dehalococcoidia bacterium]